MKVPTERKTKKKKRRWRRRIILSLTAILVLLAAGLLYVLANLKEIVLGSLRASLPGLRISADEVSLKSLSLIQVKGLRISGARGESASVVRVPRLDIGCRLHPFKGLVANRLDLHGTEAILRPGLDAVLSTFSREAKAAPPAAAGPGIARISLSNSRIDVGLPDFRLACSLEALADGSSTGTLLDNTDLSFGAKNISLDLPSLELRDLDTRLSALVTRDPTGEKIDIFRGRLVIPRILQSNFQGYVSASDSSLETELDVELPSFQLADLLGQFKKSFPELDRYRVEGQTGARLRFRYLSRDPQELLLSGTVSLRDGRAVIPIPEPLVAENVRADLPFRYAVRGQKATLSFLPDEEHLGGASISVGRIVYEETELASDLLSSLELQDQVLKSLNASFRSHGGNVTANLSGTLQDEALNLEGDLRSQDVDLSEVFRRAGIKDYDVWGKADAEVHLACATGPKGAIKVGGDLAVDVPEAVITLGKPLAVSGLKIIAPFEYSTAPDVETLGIKPNDTHPFGGTVSAARIDYGEKVAEDGTSRPQWSVSGFWGEVITTDEKLRLSITSCRAYDGDITGEITASLEKETLNYAADLRIRELDIERLLKGVGVNPAEFYMNGLVGGKLTASGSGGGWQNIEGELAAIPPGGIIRVENIEKLLESLPSGKAVLDSMKEQYTGEQWKLLVEALKEFRYRVATVNAVYTPLQDRPASGFGLELKIQLNGTGAGEEFDIPITVSVTFESD